MGLNSYLKKYEIIATKRATTKIWKPPVMAIELK